MDEPTKRVQQTTVQEGNTTQTTQDVIEPTHDRQHTSNVIARVIWFIAGILLAILGLRFILVLLGANPDNGFASFIYSISHPFVAPFFSLFGYNYRAGGSRFEIYTLVAMVVYALVAYGLARLATITQD